MQKNEHSLNIMVKKVNIWAPIIIALIALFVAIDQGYQTRKHNKLSVQPVVGIVFEYTAQGGAGWNYKNSGLGPAIIKDFEVKVDAEIVPDWKVVIKKLGLFSSVEPRPGIEFSAFRKGTIVKEDNSRKVFWVQPGLYSQKLFQNYSRVEFYSCYCSVYEECWYVSTKIIEPTPVNTCNTGFSEFGALKNSL